MDLCGWGIHMLILHFRLFECVSVHRFIDPNLGDYLWLTSLSLSHR